MSTQTETKTVIEVYDPAMCCSTGVCGPDVDDSLADFANDVKWLKAQGIEVNRFNLGQEPLAFKSNPAVLSRLQKTGSDILPIIFVNGEMVSEGGYPDRQQLLKWLSIQNPAGSKVSDDSGVSPEQTLKELQEAITRGDLPGLRSLFRKGETQGIPVQLLAEAMQEGVNKRQQVTQSTLQAANELLGIQPGGCCSPEGGCC